MTKTPEQIAAEQDFGTPSAFQRDQYFVPVIYYHGRGREMQLDRACATREEAIAFAAQYIEDSRTELVAKLRDPRYRALRAQHGLP